MVTMQGTKWEKLAEGFIEAVRVQLSNDIAIITGINIVEDEDGKMFSLEINQTFGVFFTEEQTNKLTTARVAEYIQNLGRVDI